MNMADDTAAQRLPSQRLAECHGEKLAPAELHRDLWSLFATTAAAHPGREALVSMWQDASDGGANDRGQSPSTQPCSDRPSSPCLRWTYAALLSRCRALARRLQEGGCAAGMRLVVSLWNSAEWALFFWAAARLGMVFVPIDPRAISADAQHLLDSLSPAVVVVQDADAELALRQTASAALDRAKIRISCAPATRNLGWTPLSALLHDDAGAKPDVEEPPPAAAGLQQRGVPPLAGDCVALIVFTSGTTSAPKGCLHTASGLWSQTHAFDPDRPDQVDRWLVHTPVSHIFAVNNALRAWRNGDSVVFASKSFDVRSTLRALVHERCSVMSAVPALLKALLEQPDFPSRDSLGLGYVTLGSTTITEADIRLSRDRLGSKHAIQAFGMSEGAPVVSWMRGDPLLRQGFHPGVGKALPGTNIRICAPRSRRPLLRNQVGELHIGGTSVIRGYLHSVDEDSFYTDERGRWLVTGDQASIDESDVLHILGRYKDIIIRAGENIPPAKIEAALAEIPGVSAQVVGVDDPVAGQTPVAIVDMPAGCTKAAIASKAAGLGPAYVLSDIYTLAELNLQSFPLTFTAKVRKELLREAIASHRGKATSSAPVANELQCRSGQRKASSAAEDTTLADTVDQLLSIWEALIATRPSAESRVSEYADSISLLRYCDRVLDSLGSRLCLQDFLEHETVRQQAELVCSRKRRSSPVAKNAQQKLAAPFLLPRHPTIGCRNKPLSNAKTVLVEGGFSVLPSPSYGCASRSLHVAEIHNMPGFEASATAALQPFGLQLSDVEDAFPIKDYFQQLMATGPRPPSYRHRLCFALRCRDRGHIRKATELAVASRAVLRTVLARLPDGTLFHLALKPCDALFRHIISEHEVPDEQALRELLSADSATDFSGPLMIQARIITVVSTADVSLSMTYSHSVFDMLSIEPFHSDLGRIISSTDPASVSMTPTVPFKRFAALAHLYQDSIPARSAVQFNVRRLRGISKFQAALWPQQRAPGWMVAADADCFIPSQPEALAERTASRRAVWSANGNGWDGMKANEFRFPRASRLVSLEGMEHIRSRKGIDAQTVAKAALAVHNVAQTGQPYALFNSVEAARSWPFVPTWMEEMLPPVMNIDGPTCEWVLHMPMVDISGRGVVGEEGGGRETVGQYLERTSEEQGQLQVHAHAPWFKVLEGLGPDEAAVAVEASRRQTFVWDASLRFIRADSGPKALKLVARYDWPDCGLYWNCCMVDRRNMLFIASWDTAQMSSSEISRHCDGFADVLRKIANPNNWDKALGDLFGPLGA